MEIIKNICIFLVFFSCQTTNEQVVLPKSEKAAKSENSVNVAEINLPIIPEMFWGEWHGSSGLTFKDIYPDEENLPDGQIIDLIAAITRDQVTEYVISFDTDGPPYREITPLKEYFLVNGNNLIYTWMNEGGIWTETQIWSFSVINKETIFLVLTRHVNNNYENEDNDVWNHRDYIFFTHNLNKDSVFQNENNKQAITNGNFANKPLAMDNKFQGTWIGQIKLDNQDMASDLKLEIIDSEVKLYVKYNNDGWNIINQKVCYGNL